MPLERQKGLGKRKTRLIGLVEWREGKDTLGPKAEQRNPKSQRIRRPWLRWIRSEGAGFRGSELCGERALKGALKKRICLKRGDDGEDGGDKVNERKNGVETNGRQRRNCRTGLAYLSVRKTEKEQAFRKASNDCFLLFKRFLPLLSCNVPRFF